MRNEERKTAKTILQYWAEHIIVAISTLVVGILFIIFLNPYLTKIPRDAVPFIATIFATLLGLTFTSYAIFTAFLPNLKVDFVRTKTFANEGWTFRFTIYLQLITMVISLLDYLLFNSIAFVPLIYLTVLLMILSMGFFALLVNDTFLLFEQARKTRTEEK